MRREIHEGLNVIENWNSANGFIFYGKGGEIATNRRDEQELAILSLHPLQLVLVFINAVMIQTVLQEPTWKRVLIVEDYRALTPLVMVTSIPTGYSNSTWINGYVLNRIRQSNGRNVKIA